MLTNSRWCISMAASDPNNTRKSKTTTNISTILTAIREVAADKNQK